MNRYEERVEARRARLERRAERLAEESARCMKASDDAIAGIPPGQPILVGHHSEKRHRRALERCHTNLDKALEADRASKAAARAAEAVGTAGIASEDPEALVKLREKLAGMEARQAGMKNANRQFKKGGLAAIADEALRREGARTLALCHWETRPFPSYALTNNNANIRRVRGRIAELEELAAREDTPEERHEGDGFAWYEDREESRWCFEFDERTPRETYKAMRSAGFRWSRTNERYQRHLNDGGRHACKWIAERIERGELAVREAVKP